MSRKHSLPRVIAAGCVLAGFAVAGFLLANSWLRDAPADSGSLDYQATVLKTPRPLPPVDLLDKQGQPWSVTAGDKRWRLMFFGFTHCPDICPITLTVMKQLDRRLSERGHDDLRMVFVSVDPARDDVETVRGYVEYFDPSFQGLTGQMDDIRALTGALYLPFSHTPDDSKAGYRVDHSAALVLINPQGEAIAYLTPPHDVDALTGQISDIIQSRQKGAS